MVLKWPPEGVASSSDQLPLSENTQKRFHRECETHADAGHVEKHVREICDDSAEKMKTSVVPKDRVEKSGADEGNELAKMLAKRRALVTHRKTTDCAETCDGATQETNQQELSSDDEVIDEGVKLRGDVTNRNGHVSHRAMCAQSCVTDDATLQISTRRMVCEKRRMMHSEDGSDLQEQCNSPCMNRRNAFVVSQSVHDVDLAKRLYDAEHTVVAATVKSRHRACDDDRTPLKERPPSHRGSRCCGSERSATLQKSLTTSDLIGASGARCSFNRDTSSPRTITTVAKDPNERDADNETVDDDPVQRVAAPATETIDPPSVEAEHTEEAQVTQETEEVESLVDEPIGKVRDADLDQEDAEEVSNRVRSRSDSSECEEGQDKVYQMSPPNGAASPESVISTKLNDLDSNLARACPPPSVHEAGSSSSSPAVQCFDDPLPSQRLPPPSSQTGFSSDPDVDANTRAGRRRSIKQAIGAVKAASRMSMAVASTEFGFSDPIKDVVQEASGGGESNVDSHDVSESKHRKSRHHPRRGHGHGHGHRRERHHDHNNEDQHHDHRTRRRRHDEEPHESRPRHGRREEDSRSRDAGEEERVAPRHAFFARSSNLSEAHSEADSEIGSSLPPGAMFSIEFYIDEVRPDVPGFVSFKFKRLAGVRMSTREPKFVAKRGFYAEVTRACTDTPRTYFGVNVAKLAGYKFENSIVSMKVEVSYVSVNSKAKTTFVLTSRIVFDESLHSGNIETVDLCVKGSEHAVCKRTPSISFDAERQSTPILLLLPTLFEVCPSPQFQFGTGRATREKVKLCWNLLARQSRDDFRTYQNLRDTFMFAYAQNIESAVQSHKKDVRTHIFRSRKDKHRNTASDAMSGSTYLANTARNF